MPPIEFDAEAIRNLAIILRDTGLTEIELVSGENQIRLSRGAPAAAAPPPPSSSPAVAAAQPSSGPTLPPPASDDPPAGAVPSPMVGIAFLSPDPASPPFIVPGQTVSAGQTVLLIEAMKTFNQIKAPRAGTVTRVLVANGQPVEYGQPLLVIA